MQERETLAPRPSKADKIVYPVFTIARRERTDSSDDGTRGVCSRPHTGAIGKQVDEIAAAGEGQTRLGGFSEVARPPKNGVSAPTHSGETRNRQLANQTERLPEKRPDDEQEFRDSFGEPPRSRKQDDAKLSPLGKRCPDADEGFAHNSSTRSRRCGVTSPELGSANGKYRAV